MKVELQILDQWLPGWGFPSWGLSLAAGLDLHVFTHIARPEFAVGTTLSANSRAEGRQTQMRRAGGFGSTGIEAACRGAPTGRNLDD
jgi:hypothetical protein